MLYFRQRKSFHRLFLWNCSSCTRKSSANNY